MLLLIQHTLLYALLTVVGVWCKFKINSDFININHKWHIGTMILNFLLTQSHWVAVSVCLQRRQTQNTCCTITYQQPNHKAGLLRQQKIQSECTNDAVKNKKTYLHSSHVFACSSACISCHNSVSESPTEERKYII